MTRTVQSSFYLVVSILFVLHAVYLGVVAEDAYISFRFAKNLASGNGLVWNVGDPPVEGYTNFLWVIISAAVLRAGLDIGPVAQGVGVVASLVCLAYSYLFCRRLLALGSRLSLLPCVYLAASGPFATWATSGMETNLFAMLVLSSTYHVASYWSRRRITALGVGFVLATLATLTRPEGFGVFCVLLGMHCLRAILHDGTRECMKGVLTAAVFYLPPLAVYFVWRLGYYGSMFPNTFYAKTGGTIHQWYRGAAYLFFFGFHFVCPVLPLVTAIVLVGTRRGKTARGTSLASMGKGWIDEHYAAVVSLSLCVCYSGYIVLVGGDYMAMYRFLVPILPLAYILLAYGTSVLYTERGTLPSVSTVATVLIGVGLLGTLVHSTPLESRLFSNPGITHGQRRGVLTERWHSQRLSVIGRFFNDYKKDEGESLATGAIGAVSYYSNLRIYGFHGLVDPHIAHLKHEDLGKGFPGHEKCDIAYILAKEPTYFMFTRRLTKKPCAVPEGYPPEVTELFRQHYELVAKWLEDQENGQSGYFCFLQRKSRGQR